MSPSNGRKKIVRPLTIVGWGQCHARAKQPKAATGRACACWSGFAHNQEKMSSTEQGWRDPVVDTVGRRARAARAHADDELW